MPHPELDAELERRLARVRSPWKVDGSGPPGSWPDVCQPPDGCFEGSDSPYNQALDEVRKQLREPQECLYSGKQFALLLIFQAYDAAGKDGAIREVLEGLDVNGIRVAAFKRPTPTEVAHDFLWRTTQELPERGCIGVFNRSYYEEVLAVRVHPEFLAAQYAGSPPPADLLWPERFAAIRAHERHLAVANTVILKFWLNVSAERQAERLLERIENPGKLWKHSKHDIVDSRHRPAYNEARRQMIEQTARPWAPWFVIPADDHWYLRWQIADVLLQALQALPISYPPAENLDRAEREMLSEELRARMRRAAAQPTE